MPPNMASKKAEKDKANRKKTPLNTVLFVQRHDSLSRFSGSSSFSLSSLKNKADRQQNKQSIDRGFLQGRRNFLTGVGMDGKTEEALLGIFLNWSTHQKHTRTNTIDHLGPNFFLLSCCEKKFSVSFLPDSLCSVSRASKDSRCVS
jgi:hypothetical protein